MAKLRNGGSTAEALVAFGVPRRLTPVLRWVLPVVELAVAVALVADRGRSWPGWVALGLLAGFMAVTGAALLRGRRPPCPCFGSRHARPISGRTLVRDALLVALAVLATG